jgi:hypothetical protein
VTKERRDEALALLGLAACLLFLLARTWLKWGDLVIDTGRELCVPLELLKGRVLYRDVFYLYGPLSPYLNAGAMAVFGRNVGALVLSGVVSTAAIAWLLFRICRFFLGPWPSFLCGATYLAVLSFAHYEPPGIFTHVLPYSFPSVHGTALSLGAVYGAMLWVRDGSMRSLAAAAGCSFLALLARPEMGLMALVAMAVGMVGQTRAKDAALAAGKRPGVLGWTLGPALAAGSVYAGFWWLGRAAVADSGLFGIWAANFDPGRTMTGWVFGSVGLAANLKLMGGSFLLHLLVLGTLALGSVKAADSLAAGREAAAIAAGVVTLALTALFATRGALFDVQYRIVPFVCAGLAAAAWGRLRREEGGRSDVLVLTLAAFALLFCGRMLLNVRPGHYGSHLLVPGLAFYFVALFGAVPALLPESSRRFFGWGLGVFAAASLASYFHVSDFYYRLRVLRIDSPRGSMKVFNDDRGRWNREFIEHLRRYAAPGDTLAVFPEGLGINFFSGLPNPLYHSSYLPVDLARPGVEEAVVEGLGKRRVVWAAVVQRPSGEYGAKFFGGDYGLLIRDRLLEDYEPVAGFGPPPFATPGYGIAVFRRKHGR